MELLSAGGDCGRAVVVVVDLVNLIDVGGVALMCVDFVDHVQIVTWVCMATLGQRHLACSQG